MGKNRKILIMSTIFLALIMLFPNAAQAFSFSITGPGTSSGGVSGTNASAGSGRWFLWSTFLSENARKWTYGNWSDTTISESDAYDRIVNTKEFTNNISGREGFAHRSNRAVFFYQSYLIYPAVNDVLADGTRNDTDNPIESAVKTDDHAPLWGRAYNATLKTGKPRYTWPHSTYVYSKVGELFSYGDNNGALMPEWKSASIQTTTEAARDSYVSSISSASSIDEFEVKGNTQAGSSLSADFYSIINDTSKYEGRYLVVASSHRGRGQTFLGDSISNNSGLLNHALLRIKVQRPRVRVTVVDEKTNNIITSARYDLTYKGNSSGSLTNAISGRLYGVNIDDRKTDSIVGLNGKTLTNTITDTALRDNLRSAAKGSSRANALFSSINSSNRYQNLTINLNNTNYTFDNASIASKRYDIGTFKGVPWSSIPTNTSNSSVSVNNDGQQLVIDKDLDIGSVVNNPNGISQVNGGFYEIVVFAKEKGSTVTGKVYWDNNDNKTFDRGDNLFRYTLDRTGTIKPARISAFDQSGNRVDQVNVAVNGTGEYTMTLPAEWLGKNLTFKMDLFDNPTNSYKPVLTMPAGFRYSTPTNGERTIASLSNSHTIDFGVHYPLGEKLDIDVEHNTRVIPNWLNSNIPQDIQILPENTSGIELIGDLTVEKEFVHAEMFYPINADWSFYRLKTGDANIQPVFVNKKHDSNNIVTVSQKWRRENAAMTTSQLEFSLPENELEPDKLSTVYNSVSKQFIYSVKGNNTNFSASKDDLEVKGMFKNKSGVVINWTNRAYYGTSSPGLLWSPNNGLVGFKETNGGTNYYGLSMYRISSRSIQRPDLAPVVRYKFSPLTVRNVKIFNTVGVN